MKCLSKLGITIAIVTFFTGAGNAQEISGSSGQIVRPKKEAGVQVEKAKFELGKYGALKLNAEIATNACVDLDNYEPVFSCKVYRTFPATYDASIRLVRKFRDVRPTVKSTRNQTENSERDNYSKARLTCRDIAVYSKKSFELSSEIADSMKHCLTIFVRVSGSKNDLGANVRNPYNQLRSPQLSQANEEGDGAGGELSQNEQGAVQDVVDEGAAGTR